ncbi:hypothetical protein D3C87_1566170 [compost metagenome]
MLAEQHARHVRRIRQHQEDDVGLARHLGGIGAGLHAGILERLRHAAARVGVDRVAARLKVLRHRRAHHAESDESDLAHIRIPI